MKQTLLDKLQKDLYILKPSIIAVVLGKLIENQFVDSKNYVLLLINLKDSQNKKEREIAAYAVCTLIKHSKDLDWSFILNLLQSKEFTNDIFLAMYCLCSMYNFDIQVKMNDLGEQPLLILYDWLFQDFEVPKDNYKFDYYKDKIDAWQNYIIYVLEKRETVDAFNAIKSLSLKFPDLKYSENPPIISWKRILQKYLSLTWRPIYPRDLSTLISNRQKRLVQNGDQLMDVILESLERLNEKLQGEQAVANFLWNTNNSTHKSENELSNFIKIHFDDDLKQKGIIANREVMIRPGMGDNPGEETDIHIDAGVLGPDKNSYIDICSVIIEVKGCWNAKIDSDMKEQLRDRYLKDNNKCQNGIYLIGWFPKFQKGNMSLEEAKEKYSKDAEILSRNGIKIKSFILNATLR